MHAGTVVEFDQSGVGWIDLDTGSRVRFRYGICAFVDVRVGMRVGVVRVEPGFRGVPTAIAVTSLEPPPPAVTVPDASALAEARWDRLGGPALPSLRALLRAVDEDAALRADLVRLSFEVQPMRPATIDCPDTTFTIVALDGSGNAYGLANEAPHAWVLWVSDDERLTPVAVDTVDFLSRLLDHVVQAEGDVGVVSRTRAALETRGFHLAPAGTHGSLFTGA